MPLGPTGHGGFASLWCRYSQPGHRFEFTPASLPSNWGSGAGAVLVSLAPPTWEQRLAIATAAALRDCQQRSIGTAVHSTDSGRLVERWRCYDQASQQVPPKESSLPGPISPVLIGSSGRVCPRVSPGLWSILDRRSPRKVWRALISARRIHQSTTAPTEPCSASTGRSERHGVMTRALRRWVPRAACPIRGSELRDHARYPTSRVSAVRPHHRGGLFVASTSPYPRVSASGPQPIPFRSIADRRRGSGILRLPRVGGS